MDLQSWRPAVWAAFHAQALTRTWRDVLLTLATFRGHGGELWPAHATPAQRTGGSPRTVRAALKAGQEAGLVSWVSGARRRQSNRYRLLLPATAAVPRVVRRVERVVRAIVGKWRSAGENREEKGCIGKVGWGRIVIPHAPVRTVAEQLAALRV